MTDGRRVIRQNKVAAVIVIVQNRFHPCPSVLARKRYPRLAFVRLPDPKCFLLSLLRLHIGLEDEQDLMSDLRAGLDRL